MPESAPPRVRRAGPADRSSWDRFVLDRAGGVVMQTWGWGEARAEAGWSVVRLMAEDAAGSIAGVMAVQLRPGPGGVSFAYSPRGPAVPGVEEGRGAALALVGAAVRLARRRRAVVLKLDPEWPRDRPQTLALLRAARLRPSWYDVQHRTTYLVDLDGGPDAVLARVKASTRAHVRRAERAGVVVEERGDPGAVARFQPLLAESGRRGGFVVREPGYYEAVIGHLRGSCPVALLLASAGGEAIAGAVAVAAGPRLVYLYGGSSLSRSRLHAPYAVQWAAIRWGIERGCRVYDMWGVPSHEDPGAPGAGYYEFKTRWNGRVVRHIRCQDAPLWPLLGPVPRLVERLALRGRPLLS